MTEPRIHPLSDAEADGTQAFAHRERRAQRRPEPLCARIYVRAEAGRNWLRHWNELLNGGSLPVPLKEMCRILISMKHGCGYCSTVRSRIAFESGLTEEKLMATMDYETSPLFDERERAALRFASRFKEGDDAIDSDEVYADLKRHFTEEEIIELG